MGRTGLKGPLLYSLCQTSWLGPALWLTGMCAFPPLVSQLTLPLSSGGESVSASFSAPVDKNYQLVLQFEFASKPARLQDNIVGDNYAASYDGDNDALLGKAEYGRPIPLRVVVTRKADNSILLDKQFNSLCSIGYTDTRKSRGVGWIYLPRGEYTLEVTNIVAQAGLAEVQTFIALLPGQGK